MKTLFALALTCLLLLSGCAAGEQEAPREWVDYLSGEETPWGREASLELPEFPGVTFRWTLEEVAAVEGDDTEPLFQGMPVWNVFLADLNGDRLPEFCATVSFGSGIVDNRILVCDYAAHALYELSDRMRYDYSLSLRDGQLIVTRRTYGGPEEVHGALVLTPGEDGGSAALSLEVQE